MTIVWITAALLAGGLLLFVGLLLGRGWRLAPGDRALAIAAAIAVPALVALTYFTLGGTERLEEQRETAEAGQPHATTQEQIEAMVENLAQRLKAQPDDAEGWAMLARSYGSLGRFGDASSAYARAAALMPDNARLLADYADALAMSSGRSLQGEPEKIIQQALRADPNNIKALMLAGTAAFERRDYQSAIERWQKILDLVPADSESARSISASLDEARKLAGQQSPPGAQTTGPVQGRPGTVSGTVHLAPALKARVADTDVVFIFARAAEGRAPPLAAMRKTVKDLPLTFTMDDSMAMMPDRKLSSASSVVVGARISKAGDVTPSPGDLEGFSQAVQVGQKGIVITIDSEVK